LAAKLNEAQQKTRQPLLETWAEAQTLLEALNRAPDPREARLRLRTALRLLIEQVYLLVVARGRVRLCAVQVFFRADKDGRTSRRDYLIFYRAAARHQKASWRCWSLAEVTKPGELDLRKPEHARELEALLLALDLEALEG
jgi:hypothetical protein